MYQSKAVSKGQILYLFFCPRMHSRTFLNCFALELGVLETKQLGIVLGPVLGQKTRYKTPPLNTLYKFLYIRGFND